MKYSSKRFLAYEFEELMNFINSDYVDEVISICQSKSNRYTVFYRKAREI